MPIVLMPQTAYNVTVLDSDDMQDARFNTMASTNTQFLYSTSSSRVTLYDKDTIIDPDVSIGPATGEYVVIYTANFAVRDPDDGDPIAPEPACGKGWVKLVKGNTAISKTLRFFESPKSGGSYVGTIVVIDKLTLNGETVKVQIYFDALDNEYMFLTHRSLIAIPLGQYSYSLSTQQVVINEGSYKDRSVKCEGGRSYLIMYTAAFEVFDPDQNQNVNAWGSVIFTTSSGDISKTRRSFEVGGFNVHKGTLICIDVIYFSSTTYLSSKIYFGASDNEKLRLRERSMIAIPLSQYPLGTYYYRYTTQTASIREVGTREDLSCTISSSGKYLVIYTAAFSSSSPVQFTHGWGRVRLGDGTDFFTKTTRSYEVPTTCGTYYQGTILSIDILLPIDNVRVQIYWDADHAPWPMIDTLTLRERSLIVIGEYSSGGGGGGCPHVASRSSNKLNIDNNILPQVIMKHGEFVKDHYILRHKLRSHSLYALEIFESNRNISFFDAIKLIAIGHADNINVAVDQYGNIVTYMNPRAPLWGRDANGHSILEFISNLNDSKYFISNGTQSLILNFGEVSSSDPRLIIRSAIYNPSTVITPKGFATINVLTTDGWELAGYIFPRNFWSISAISLNKFINMTNGSVVIRIDIWSQQMIDFIGLETSNTSIHTVKQRLKIVEFELIMALKFGYKRAHNVLKLLIEEDKEAVKMLPYEKILLLFKPKKNVKMCKDITWSFLLIVIGYYI